MAVKQFIVWCVHYGTVAIILLILFSAIPGTAFLYYSWITNFILYLFLAQFTYHYFRGFYNKEYIESLNKAVLITGCDSGFGNELAKRLDSKEFHVFASCLFPEEKGAIDLRESCSSRLKIFGLDVTKDESVKEAFTFVSQNLGSNDLWAVVNNAGIANSLVPIDFCTMDNFKDTIDVNALGPVRVTKAFLPLLKKSKGRVVNVTSLGGRIPSRNACPYTMSKYAAVAFTECLSQEMKEWGIRAVSIEPEMFRTGITNTITVIKNIRNEINKADKELLLSYGEKYLKEYETYVSRGLSFSCPNINIVVDAMESAITAKDPHHVYKPCRNIFFGVLCELLRALPFELFEKFSAYNAAFLGHPVPKDVTNLHSRL